jgi:hypothetical protein
VCLLGDAGLSSDGRAQARRRLTDSTSARLTTALLDAWPRISRDEARSLSSALTRLAVSYALIPAPNPAAAAAAFAPCLERLAAGTARAAPGGETRSSSGARP